MFRCLHLCRKDLSATPNLRATVEVGSASSKAANSLSSGQFGLTIPLKQGDKKPDMGTHQQTR
jgi:hypothetical protein